MTKKTTVHASSYGHRFKIYTRVQDLLFRRQLKILVFQEVAFNAKFKSDPEPVSILNSILKLRKRNSVIYNTT